MEKNIDLIQKYYPLVRKNAFLYGGSGIEFEDLIQEGTIGLIKALEYKKQRHSIISYIDFWIKKYMLEYLENSTKSFVTTSQYFRIKRKIEAVKKDYFEKNNKEIDLKTLSELTQINPHKIIDIENLINSTTQTELETVADTENLESEIIKTEVYNTLFKCISELEIHEEIIIRLHFGLDFQVSKSLDEIADILSMKKMDVYYIEKRALQKLNKKLKNEDIDITAFFQ